jgi:hypothetical protein
VIGMKTAAIAAAVPSTIRMSPMSGFPSISPRDALARIEIGLALTKS